MNQDNRKGSQGVGAAVARWLLAGGLLALAGGCANPAAQQALSAQNLLVGMPKQTLLSCAGVPNRQASVDNRDYFTYHSSRVIAYPGWGGYGGWWGPGYGYGVGGPVYGGDIDSIDCEATFTLHNGVVERVVYGGASGGGGALNQCYAIVRNCLALVPRSTPGVPGSPTP